MRTLLAFMMTGLLTLPSYAVERINVAPRDISYLSIEFGQVSLGKYAQVEVGINAPQDKALTITELSLAGEMFNAATNCSSTIEAGKFCVIDIYFEPKAVGEHYGELGIKTSEGNILLQLYGTGVSAK